MENTTIIRTGCKINLFLRVGPRLPDGYHELETFFLPLSTPHDTLNIIYDVAESTEKRPGLTVTCNVPGIPLQRNTLTKAYEQYALATGYAPALRVHLEKSVPHGAGLGGGSANAAGLLLYLQKKNKQNGNTPLSMEHLIPLAKVVGADVPFFLLNTPAHAAGVGERLTPAPNPFANWHIVLICPGINISTAWAFAELDTHRENFLKKNINNLTTSDCRATTSFAHGMKLGNDFEEMIFKAFPRLHRLCDTLREKGAYAAHVSGTGSSVFGLFPGAAEAKAAAGSFKEKRVYVQAV